MVRRVIRHLQWRWRMFRHIHWPQYRYSRYLPPEIQSGPFSGMIYRKQATGSVILPKLLGTYEDELHPVWAGLPWAQYDAFVDVGAGEGYYAVGMCWRHPAIKGIAFEKSKKGRKQIGMLARLNGVADRLEVRGYCSVADLNAVLSGLRRPLLIMDVEGLERILLDPQAVPALQRTDFVAEVHPETDAGLGELLWQRFSGSHTLHRIDQQPKTIPDTVRLPKALQTRGDALCNEFRGPQFWLIGMARQVL